MTVEFKKTFREQQWTAREDAILDAVNRLLATKGYDLMTMDDVAGEVGIAKASLYKHFTSKDALAAAAMTRIVHHAQERMREIPDDLPPRAKLEALLRWGVGLHLVNQMPILPTSRSGIVDALMAHAPYFVAVTEVTMALGEWIVSAQADGSLSKSLPPDVLLYTILARARDPVAEILKVAGDYDDAAIVEFLVATCFDGIATRPT